MSATCEFQTPIDMSNATEPGAICGNRKESLGDKGEHTNPKEPLPQSSKTRGIFRFCQNQQHRNPESVRQVRVDRHNNVAALEQAKNALSPPRAKTDTSRSQPTSVRRGKVRQNMQNQTLVIESIRRLK